MPERDANGRFVKGNSAAKGKGRPPKEREERYYEILISAVSFSDWRKIVQKAADQAKRGDAAARKWLADYIVGTPDQNLNLKGGPLLIEVIGGYRNDATGDA